MASSSPAPRPSATFRRSTASTSPTSAKLMRTTSTPPSRLHKPRCMAHGAAWPYPSAQPCCTRSPTASRRASTNSSRPKSPTPVVRCIRRVRLTSPAASPISAPSRIWPRPPTPTCSRAKARTVSAPSTTPCASRWAWSASSRRGVIRYAGVPPGVFNLIHGFGGNSAGEFLTRHPDIDAITFTGESKTGSTIMKAVADGMKEVSFELGGKNAAVVFADADFDAAVAGVMRSSFTNSGQVCLCSERVYVERSIFDRFVAAMKEKTQALKIGYPAEDNVDMGPLISHGHRDKVLSYYRLAVEEGATVVAGGGIPTFNDERDDGAYVQPTIWTGLPDDARCVTEEIFGPVCHIAPFDREDEVIGRINDSDYGLACAIWTSDLKRAHRVAPQIEAGLVWVNTWYLRDLRTPFGGVKQSGLGREGGRYSLDFYSEVTNICIKL